MSTCRQSVLSSGLVLTLALATSTAVSAQAADMPAHYAQASTPAAPTAKPRLAKATPAPAAPAAPAAAKAIDAKAAAKAAEAKAAEAKAAARIAEAKAAEAKAAEAKAAAKAAEAAAAEAMAAKARAAETRAAEEKAAARAAAAVQADPAANRARAARTRFLEARIAMDRALMLPDLTPTTNIIALEVAMHGMRTELKALEQISPSADAVKKAVDLAQDWHRSGSKVVNPPAEGVVDLPMPTALAAKANAAAAAIDKLIADATARATVAAVAAEPAASAPQRSTAIPQRRVHAAPVAPIRTATSIDR
ncbi:MAG TPA: hypothetical protein VKE26_04280 [Xanthobacteraceae bacterium]|nr:hypothetical protein [Xanthobacteraceae bacterium]